MATHQNTSIFSGNRFFLFKALLFCLLCVSGWLIFNIQNLQEFLDVYEKRNLEIEQIENLKQQIRNLEKQQRSLQLNGIEAERQVRERWQMHKPGEKVIFLKPEGSPKRELAGASASTTQTVVPGPEEQSLDNKDPEAEIVATPAPRRGRPGAGAASRPAVREEVKKSSE